MNAGRSKFADLVLSIEHRNKSTRVVAGRNGCLSAELLLSPRVAKVARRREYHSKFRTGSDFVTNRDRQAHWKNVYATKREDEVSWFQESPQISLDLIEAAHLLASASIIDIGGGASRLVDALLDKGYANVSVLDISEKALAVAKTRLGKRASSVNWIVADFTTWEPSEKYDLWHDRAAFHFLTEPNDRSAYAECVLRGVKPEGHVIIGTFALDGPEQCSGLPIVRYDASSIAKIFGSQFEVAETRDDDHQTPMGRTQKFQFSRFHRRK